MLPSVGTIAVFFTILQDKSVLLQSTLKLYKNWQLMSKIYPSAADTSGEDTCQGSRDPVTHVPDPVSVYDAKKNMNIHIAALLLPLIEMKL